MINALQNGSWFIFGHFLSVQLWEPNFVPSKAKQSLTAIWIRLLQLPTEFYDETILKKVGNTIGRVLNVDVCASLALRGHYARLCVELPLLKAAKSNVWIGSHKQQILYECDKLLCLNCGHLGHLVGQCKKAKTQSNKTSTEKEEEEQLLNMQEQSHKIDEEWRTVTFNKGNKKSVKIDTQEVSNKAGINVNIYDANTGKFLSSQTLCYKARPNTGKNIIKEESTLNNNKFQSKNHFSALMDEDMVLENPTIFFTRKNN